MVRSKLFLTGAQPGHPDLPSASGDGAFTLTGVHVLVPVRVIRMSEAHMSGSFTVTRTSTDTCNSVAIKTLIKIVKYSFIHSIIPFNSGSKAHKTTGKSNYIKIHKHKNTERQTENTQHRNILNVVQQLLHYRREWLLASNLHYIFSVGGGK